MIHKIHGLLWHRSPDELCPSEPIRREFLRESVRKNDFSLWIICAIVFVAEGFNIIRVVFLSSSGLGTRNNRIYFSMYCALLLIALLWLALRPALRRGTVRLRWTAQCVMTGLLFLWHMGLNTYDLYRDPAAQTTVLTTALLGLALLIQSPPAYTTAMFAAGYLLFSIVMAPLLEAGDRLNLTITFVVALAVSDPCVSHLCDAETAETDRGDKREIAGTGAPGPLDRAAQ